MTPRRSWLARLTALLLLTTPLAACGESDPADGGPAPEMDAGPGPTPDAGPPSVADVCDELGFPRAEFVSAGGGELFGSLAGDFTANTLDGVWNLEDEWTGCDSYVFITYVPDLRAPPQIGEWQGDTVWNSFPDDLFRAGPRNVHYFFASLEDSESDRRERMEQMRLNVRDGFETFLEPDEIEFWETHFHYVTDRVTEIDGSVGDMVSSYLTYMGTDEAITDLGDRGMVQAPLPYAFGIDRGQRFDAGGSLSPVVGRPQEMGMAAFFGHFYNGKHAIDLRLDADDPSLTTVELIDDTVTERIFDETVTLPDAETMATYDRFEIDIEVDCTFQSPFQCNEWDRIARIALCADETCEERQEIVRWITQYWRRGRRRWGIDATPMLPLLAEGGTQTFRIEMGPVWERPTERDARMSLRFYAGDEDKPVGAVSGYGGGNFNETYNDRDPVTFTPPSDASRVELVVILSGHGQTDGDNCAEWCDHRHEFSVNGSALDVIRHEGSIGSLGCAARADEGIPPGQWGNWAPERAYWCPGLPVDAMRIDITDQVTLGSENELTYRGTLGAGTDPRGGNISMSSYVTWYR